MTLPSSLALMGCVLETPYAHHVLYKSTVLYPHSDLNHLFSVVFISLHFLKFKCIKFKVGHHQKYLASIEQGAWPKLNHGLEI